MNRLASVNCNNKNSAVFMAHIVVHYVRLR